MNIPPLLACEPIVPLTMSFLPWSAAAARIGIVALLIVVLVKCVAFAVLQRGEMPTTRAVSSMFLANVVSTIAGVFAAFTFIAPSAAIGGIVATIVVSILPIRRLVERTRTSAPVITVVIVLLYLGSIALFALAQEMVLENDLAAYWLMKYGYIVSALLISMLLTTFWEEWVVWRMSGAEEQGFVTPVFRANAIALFLIMLVAALIVLPQRLRSPDFLIAILHCVA